MPVKPYELPANYVPSSTYSETMNHLTVQLSYVLQWFYLVGFWGMGGERGFRVHIMCQCHKCHACHKVKVDVTKCHAAWHTKWRSMSPSATPATQHGRRCHQVPRLPHKMKVAPATQNETGCRQVPCLPILTATMVLPFKLLGGGVGGLGITTVDGSGC